MYTKLLAFTLLLTSLDPPTFALDLVKAKIIGHQEWTTGNAKGWFTPGPVEYMALPPSANTSAYVGYTEGLANTNTTIYGQHSFYIINNTLVTQWYHYQFKLCANNYQCFNYIDYVEVQAGGHAGSSGNSTVLAYFSKPGTYPSYASTVISGESPGSQRYNNEIYIHT